MQVLTCPVHAPSPPGWVSCRTVRSISLSLPFPMPPEFIFNPLEKNLLTPVSRNGGLCIKREHVPRCFLRCSVSMAGPTQSLCRLALLYNLILSSRALNLQIFISVVTQCLLDRNIKLNRPPPRCAFEDIPFLF